MKGKHRVIVSTKRLKYDFEIQEKFDNHSRGQRYGKNYSCRYDSGIRKQSIRDPVELTCDKKMLCARRFTVERTVISNAG